jgi:hypothetical protein
MSIWPYHLRKCCPAIIIHEREVLDKKSIIIVSRRSPCQPPFPLPLQEEVAGRLTKAGRPYPLFSLKPWRSSLPHHPRSISEIDSLTWFDCLAARVVHRVKVCGSWVCTFIRSIDVRLRLGGRIRTFLYSKYLPSLYLYIYPHEGQINHNKILGFFIFYTRLV